jgi:hypothetical protein
MVVEAAPIPDPRTVWVRSSMTETKIQSLVDRRLLRPKAEVEWKAAVGEEFPTEDVKEQVVFASYFERGLLAVDFRQPRTLVMLWFELHFGTNPPLGILIISQVHCWMCILEYSVFAGIHVLNEERGN